MAKKKIDQKEILLAVYHTKDAEGASQALLKADIPYERRRIGAGEHGNFLMSLNNYGEEFYVSGEDMERARKVIEEWRQQKNDLRRQEQLQAQEEKTPESEAQDRKVLGARIFAGILLVLLVAVYLWSRR